MSLSRYEEIFLRLAAAEIANPVFECSAAGVYESLKYYAGVARRIEEHFEEREHAILKQRLQIEGTPLPALLRRQAE